MFCLLRTHSCALLPLDITKLIRHMTHVCAMSHESEWVSLCLMATHMTHVCAMSHEFHTCAMAHGTHMSHMSHGTHMNESYFACYELTLVRSCHRTYHLLHSIIHRHIWTYVYMHIYIYMSARKASWNPSCVTRWIPRSFLCGIIYIRINIHIPTYVYLNDEHARS